jgi:hypothetical protein
VLKQALATVGGVAAAVSSVGFAGLLVVAVIVGMSLVFACWLLRGDSQTDRLVKVLGAMRGGRGGEADEDGGGLPAVDEREGVPS